MGYFDYKIFNGEVFQKYVDRVPNTKLNELLKSGAVVNRADLKQNLTDQTGGNYVTTPLKGLIRGTTPLNYDGATNMTAVGTKSYSHSRVVAGRMAAWTENDFTWDITGNLDPMENVAQQIASYDDEVRQDILIATLQGAFATTGTKGDEFRATHSTDITGVINTEGDTGKMDATTLNTAMQKACGDNKGKFSMAVMHSAVATNLENHNLLTYLKYNDENGMQRDTSMATINGRLVLVDDSMPSENVYAKTTDVALVEGKTYYTYSEGVYTPVENPDVSDIGDYYEVTGKKYTTFILGNGAIEYTDCGARVPSEMGRDPKTNGGQDTLYIRRRWCFAPYGISFKQNYVSTLSPTNAELADGRNWELVNTGGVSPEVIDLKAIPIARVISLG